jgi:IS30 family transposase
MDRTNSTTTGHRKGHSFEDRVLIQTRLNDGWNPNMIAKEIGCAPEEGLFTKDQIVCTKTLYRYVGLGLLGIKNIDLPEELHRSPKKVKDRENKRVPGQSIEERPSEVNDRSEFGHRDNIFKTITTDNGSEFSMLSQLEDFSKTPVYFAHPYTSWEKGSVERHNGLIRRFIPKGKRIDSYSDEQIAQIETWCNSLPRKLLGYRTPDDLFEEELDRIYSCVA